MIQETVARLAPKQPAGKFLDYQQRGFAPEHLRQLPELPPSQVIAGRSDATRLRRSSGGVLLLRTDPNGRHRHVSLRPFITDRAAFATIWAEAVGDPAAVKTSWSMKPDPARDGYDTSKTRKPIHQHGLRRVAVRQCSARCGSFIGSRKLSARLIPQGRKIFSGTAACSLVGGDAGCRAGEHLPKTAPLAGADCRTPTARADSAETSSGLSQV